MSGERQHDGDSVVIRPCGDLSLSLELHPAQRVLLRNHPLPSLADVNIHAVGSRADNVGPIQRPQLTYFKTD